jgi:hypothetical protein
LIAVGGDAQWHPLGSAFVIAVADPRTAFLLTATHSIDHAVAIDQPRPRHAATLPDILVPDRPRVIGLKRTRICALVTDPEPSAIAELETAWALGAHDVALLLVRIPEAYPGRFVGQLPIDFSPVPIGTQLLAIGYPGTKARFAAPPDYDNFRFSVTLDTTLERRPTTVLEHCPTGSGIHRWPGFFVDCAFDSGMSGGPLIELRDSLPVVRGLVGGDLSAGEDHAIGSGLRAFASILWPALATPIGVNVCFDTDPTLKVVGNLLDMVRFGLIDDRGNALAHLRLLDAAPQIIARWENG